MNRLKTFGESFLDGFTMAGFPAGSPRPGAAEYVIEPEASLENSSVSFLFSPELVDVVKVSGDLHQVPEPALKKMMEMLEGEANQRKQYNSYSEKLAHGTSH